MRHLSRFATSVVTIGVAASAVILPISAGIAAAGPGETRVPLGSRYRACDFTPFLGTPEHSEGFGFAVLRVSGGAVTADVRIDKGLANTRYDVRLIQAPRPSSKPCGAGAPGVTAGAFQTDATGSGSVTLTGAITPESNGVWVFMSLPSRFSQIPDASYTSGSITKYDSGP